ncbi:MAG: serine--tRNA ligase [Pseudolabrys sp.]|nr:serine--tRNA ligase [Pseudolabrys sp.]
MHDIKWIRDNAAAFDKGLARRGLEPLAEKLIALDEKRRAAILASEQAQARRNAASKEIGAAKAKKDDATAQALMAEVAKLKETMPALEAEAKEFGDELDKELAQIPNLPAADVPDGADEHGNIEHHVSGRKRDYAFTPKEHFDLGAGLGMMDFELAAKLSGARFVVLQKGLARMERALGQFMLDLHTDQHGYTEVNPPLLVRDEAMFGTAQLPKFMHDQFMSVSGTLTPAQRKQQAEEQARLKSRTESVVAFHEASAKMFELIKNTLGSSNVAGEKSEKINEFLDSFGVNSFNTEFELAKYLSENAALESIFEDSRWLIPTAEVPLTNLVRESIVDEDSLPRRYTACTPCFRAEAGAAGRDTRGMIRQHQFTKVELVSITTPGKAREEHERMLACAEEVLKKLDLHYRVMTLCTGDMGFASQKTYDIEVWLPGQNMYREISSCSVCGDFQARRMNARYRGKDGKPAFVHTLNGSGVAVGRALVAVMETYQQDDGAIAVPDVLQPYMGGMKKIEKTA